MWQSLIDEIKAAGRSVRYMLAAVPDIFLQAIKMAAYTNPLTSLPTSQVIQIERLIKELNKLRKRRTDLTERIDKAQSALSDAKNVIEELENQIEEDFDELQDLQQPLDHYSRLVDVEKENARAVIDEARSYGKLSWVKFIATNLAINLFGGLILLFLGAFLRPHVVYLVKSLTGTGGGG